MPVSSHARVVDAERLDDTSGVGCATQEPCPAVVGRRFRKRGASPTTRNSRARYTAGRAGCDPLPIRPHDHPFGLTVRLETLALAGVVFVALVLAALGAGRMRSRFEATPDGSAQDAARLRRDDLILIAFGAVPGAVVGGRLDYGLIHFDYFSIDLSRLTDPGQGGLALSLAVLFGSVTALAVALLLAAPIGRWLHVASGPLLVGLGLGKLAMVLGADGQGQFSDAGGRPPTCAPGPGRASARIPRRCRRRPWRASSFCSRRSHARRPGGAAASFEALAVDRPAGPGPRREWRMLTGYRRFLTALCLWSVARFAAAFTWRDAQVAGPFRAEQVC